MSKYILSTKSFDSINRVAVIKKIRELSGYSIKEVGEVIKNLKRHNEAHVYVFPEMDFADLNHFNVLGISVHRPPEKETIFNTQAKAKKSPTLIAGLKTLIIDAINRDDFELAKSLIETLEK